MGNVDSTIYLLKDTMEVFAKDIEGKTYFFGLTTEGAVRRSISQDLIRAGLKSKVVGVLSTDEAWSIDVTTGLHYKELMEIQLGSDFESGTKTIQEVSSEGVVSSKEVTGDIIDLEPDRFGKTLEDVQLHTIAYDPDTNVIVADIYWNFFSAFPDGNFEQVLGAGTNNIQTTTLTPTVAKGKTNYGYYAIVPREGAMSGYGTIVVHGVKSENGDTLYVDVMTKRLGEYAIEAKAVTGYTNVTPANATVKLETKGETKMVVFEYSS